MITREKTLKIKVGNLYIGGSNDIIIQSMCTHKTSKTDLVIKQINELEKVGCKLIRVSILDENDAKAISEIKKHISIPLVADIHFDYKLAILAIKNGADKIRINPGNLGDISHFKAVIEEAKKTDIAIRIGVNSGSISKEFLTKFKDPRLAMIQSMVYYIDVAEKLGFKKLILSIKSSSVVETIKANEFLATTSRYPLHLGITEAGDLKTSLVRSSAGLGILLNEGLGNTIRISISDSPNEEIYAAKELLNSFNLIKDTPKLISCPTCGRCEIDLFKVVNKIKPILQEINKPISVAIMGCIVNGPGEASNADIGIAGGHNEFVLFKKGKIIAKYNEDEIVDVLIKEIKNL